MDPEISIVNYLRSMREAKLKDEAIELVRELHTCLEELFAQVKGECPSLLEEDSGGDAVLHLAIKEVLNKSEKYFTAEEE